MRITRVGVWIAVFFLCLLAPHQEARVEPGHKSISSDVRGHGNGHSVTTPPGQPTIDVDVSPLEGDVPLTITIVGEFRDLVSCEIFFGDGAVSTWTADGYRNTPSLSIDESYEYSAPGTYELWMFATGLEVTASQNMIVTVHPPDPVLGDVPNTQTLAYDEDWFVISVANQDGGMLEWSISSDVPWLDVLHEAGVGDKNVLVTVDRTGLAAGTYTGHLNITSNGGNATMTVIMEVITTPVLQVSPGSLTFYSPAQIPELEITNGGPVTLDWSATPDRPWIHVAPASGSGEASVTVTLDADLMGSDTDGVISIESNGGTATIPVTVIPSTSAGYLGVFADAGGTLCVVPDDPEGVVAVHIIHKATPGAGAMQAALRSSHPSGFVYLGETSQFATTIGSMWIHDDDAGGAVAYGGCYTAPILVKTVNLMTLGTNPPCTSLCVVPDPVSLSGNIEVADCDNVKREGTGWCLSVGLDGACGCAPPTPVAPTTWGTIKAHYVDWDTPAFRSRQR